MLKFAFLLCAVITLTVGQRPIRPKDQEVIHLPPELVIKVQKFTRPCIEKYNADPDIFGKLIAGTMSGDDASKDFLYCFAVAGNFTDVEGHFNIPRMTTFIGDHPKRKGFEEALGECNKITKETPRETVYEMSFCINEKAPVVFIL